MNRNSNLNPLPWYETLGEQGFRKHWAYGKVWPLIAHRDFLLPFQLKTSGVSDMADIKVYMHKFDSDISFEITDMLVAAGLTLDDSTASYGYRNLVFPATFAFDWTIQGMDFNNDFNEDFGGPDRSSIGRYYLSVVADLGQGKTRTWYSEVMTFVLDLQGYLKLEWFSLSDLAYDGGVILYTYGDNSARYANYLWVPADVAMPDYTFEEEGEERDGYFFPTKQTSEKTYRFAFLATEEICDALRIVGLSDKVMVTDPMGRKYECDRFSMTPEWQQQGYLAAVNCEFQTDTVVIRRAQAYTPAQSRMVLCEGIEGIFPTSTADTYRVSAKGGELVLHIYPANASVNVTDLTMASAAMEDDRTARVVVAKNTGAARTADVEVYLSGVTEPMTVTLNQDGVS